MESALNYTAVMLNIINSLHMEQKHCFIVIYNIFNSVNNRCVFFKWMIQVHTVEENTTQERNQPVF